MTVYVELKACWKQEPADRPTIQQLALRLREIENPDMATPSLQAGETAGSDAAGDSLSPLDTPGPDSYITVDGKVVNVPVLERRTTQWTPDGFVPGIDGAPATEAAQPERDTSAPVGVLRRKSKPAVKMAIDENDEDEASAEKRKSHGEVAAKLAKRQPTRFSIQRADQAGGSTTSIPAIELTSEHGLTRELEPAMDLVVEAQPEPADGRLTPSDAASLVSSGNLSLDDDAISKITETTSLGRRSLLSQDEEDEGAFFAATSKKDLGTIDLW